MRIRGRHRRSRGTPALPNPVVEQRIRLIGLLDTVTRAVELQPEADAVIAACALPGETPSWVARRGGRVANEYCRLYGWAADLAKDAPRDSVPARAVELINYHGALLDVCLQLAFPRIPTPILEQRRRALRGLGEPARTLRDIRVLLLMCVDDLADPGS